MPQKVDALSIFIKGLLLDGVIDLKRLFAESMLSAGMGNACGSGLLVEAVHARLECGPFQANNVGATSTGPRARQMGDKRAGFQTGRRSPRGGTEVNKY
jgi:hypothetical protein